MPEQSALPSGALDEALTLVEAHRIRANKAEALADARRASIVQLARSIPELRCQLAGLLDDLLCTPPPQHGLRNIVARASLLADQIAHAVTGYTQVQADDMAYPELADDLRQHQWTPRPQAAIPYTLPPLPIGQIDQVRGARHGWHRAGQGLTLWFTSPVNLAHAATDGGRLLDLDQLQALIRSAPPSRRDLDRWVANHTSTILADSFDAPYVRVFSHLQACWYGCLVEEYRSDQFGNRADGGKHRASVWRCPSDQDLRITFWGKGDSPAHVRYWAGGVADMRHLLAITGTYR